MHGNYSYIQVEHGQIIGSKVKGVKDSIGAPGGGAVLRCHGTVKMIEFGLQLRPGLTLLLYEG